jgi:hypothetical protein
MTMGESGGDRAAGRERPSPWPELFVGLVLFGLYSMVAGMKNPERTATADRNGRWIYELERWLHIDVEPAMNHWLAPHEVLRTLANTSTRRPTWRPRRRPSCGCICAARTATAACATRSC